MENFPRISLVTPSYNQGRYIRGTVESVLAQQYPNLEYIIVDGGSTDDTLNILRQYPNIKVISERDQGQWDAINKGFSLATGDIWGYINSDDTLLTGALDRVAREINPDLGRKIVMGRCKFIDQEGNLLGYEHPSGYKDHIRILEIWKGHTIPQPTVFWVPEVWRTCGGMDGKLNSAWLDYDLFCRFSRFYQFHFIDQILATYRLHLESKTSAKSEHERLEESIHISRRYWGSKWSLKYMRLAASLAWYRLNLNSKAHKLHNTANSLRENHMGMKALVYDGLAVFFAPKAFFYKAIYPTMRQSSLLNRIHILGNLVKINQIPPQTAAFLEYDRPWSDGWCGPHVKLNPIMTGSGKDHLVLQLEFDIRYIQHPMALSVSTKGTQLGAITAEKNGAIEVVFEISDDKFGPVVIESDCWYIPHQFFGNGDYRPLSWRLTSCKYD